MNLQLQAILMILCALFLIYLIHKIQTNVLDLRYTLVWIALDIALIILSCFPKLLEVTSRILGITTPINAVFFFGFIFSIIIMFVLTIAISRASNRIKTLSQRIALLEKKTESTKSKNR